MIGSTVTLTRRPRQPSARFTLSRVSKCGLSFSATTLKTGAPIDIHLDVAEVLHAHKPAVALGPITATHGMPYPVNLETAKSVGRIIRIWKAYQLPLAPPTDVKLEPHELERLAECKNRPVKLSRRDTSAAIALKRDGGTTRSATLVLQCLRASRCDSTSHLP